MILSGEHVIWMLKPNMHRFVGGRRTWYIDLKVDAKISDMWIDWNIVQEPKKVANLVNAVTTAHHRQLDMLTVLIQINAKDRYLCQMNKINRSTEIEVKKNKKKI